MLIINLGIERAGRSPMRGDRRIPYENTVQVFWLMYVHASGDVADVLVRAPSLELARMVVDESELVDWSYETPILMGDSGHLRKYVGSAPVRRLTPDEATNLLATPRYVVGKPCKVYAIDKKPRRRKNRLRQRGRQR